MRRSPHSSDRKFSASAVTRASRKSPRRQDDHPPLRLAPESLSSITQPIPPSARARKEWAPPNARCDSRRSIKICRFATFLFSRNDFIPSHCHKESVRFSIHGHRLGSGLKLAGVFCIRDVYVAAGFKWHHGGMREHFVDSTQRNHTARVHPPTLPDIECPDPTPTLLRRFGPIARSSSSDARSRVRGHLRFTVSVAADTPRERLRGRTGNS